MKMMMMMMERECELCAAQQQRRGSNNNAVIHSWLESLISVYCFRFESMEGGLCKTTNNSVQGPFFQNHYFWIIGHWAPPPNCWICRGDDFYLFYPRMCCFFFEIICLIYGFSRVCLRGRPFFPCGRSFLLANKRGVRACLYQEKVSPFSFFLSSSWKCYVYVHMDVYRVRYLFWIRIDV